MQKAIQYKHKYAMAFTQGEMRGTRVKLKFEAINNSHKDFVFAQEG